MNKKKIYIAAIKNDICPLLECGCCESPWMTEIGASAYAEKFNCEAHSRKCEDCGLQNIVLYSDNFKALAMRVLADDVKLDKKTDDFQILKLSGAQVSPPFLPGEKRQVWLESLVESLAFGEDRDNIINILRVGGAKLYRCDFCNSETTLSGGRCKRHLFNE